VILNALKHNTYATTGPNQNKWAGICHVLQNFQVAESVQAPRPQTPPLQCCLRHSRTVHGRTSPPRLPSSGQAPAVKSLLSTADSAYSRTGETARVDSSSLQKFLHSFSVHRNSAESSIRRMCDVIYIYIHTPWSLRLQKKYAILNLG
jgi:hypothetical protein